MFLLNSRRSAAAIGLEIISTHAKLMFFLRPLMSWASFSRSVDTGVTGRVSTNSQTCVAPDWRMSCIEPEATGATGYGVTDRRPAHLHFNTNTAPATGTGSFAIFAAIRHAFRGTKMG